jgi:transcriptional regulator with XRE-family HTH domain
MEEEAMSSTVVGPESPPADLRGEAYWRNWMREVGRQMRTVREFVGQSQEDLARAAGVSQGAVSRLETGRGLATPLLIFVKIHVALAGVLRRFDPELLNEPARRMLEAAREISPPVGDVGSTFLPITLDPTLDRLIQRYNRLPERRRLAATVALDAVLDALIAEESIPPPTSAQTC